MRCLIRWRMSSMSREGMWQYGMNPPRSICASASASILSVLILACAMAFTLNGLARTGLNPESRRRRNISSDTLEASITMPALLGMSLKNSSMSPNVLGILELDSTLPLLSTMAICRESLWRSIPT